MTTKIRALSPPGSFHPSTDDRMKFVEWVLSDEISTLHQDLPAYKRREKLIEKYLNDFSIKISIPFFAGLHQLGLACVRNDDGIRYYFEKSPIVVSDYCKNPTLVLKKVRERKA